jgi:hypothetical protein
LTLHFNGQIDCPPNNISIDEIARASQANHSIMHEEYLNEDLNYQARVSQTINFEEKISQYLETYKTAASPVRSKMYHELDREFTMLEKEQLYITNLQDPPEMTARRTFGRGGRRLLTAAERAEKELKHNDKEHNKQSTTSANEVVDLTIDFNSSSQNTPPCSMNSNLQHITPRSINSFSKQSNSLIFSPRPFIVSQPLIMTFSRSGQVIRGHQQLSSNHFPSSALSLQPSTTDVNRLQPSVQHSITQVNQEDIEKGPRILPEIVVLGPETEEKCQAKVNMNSRKRTRATQSKFPASLISSIRLGRSERLCQSRKRLRKE